MIPIASNDNHPRRAADMKLAERRAWLATLPDHYKPVLAWPTAERLARLESPAAAAALFRYAELDRPARPVAVNDNDPDNPMDADARHEYRPSVDEVLAAANADLVLTFDSRERANNGWRIGTVDGRPVGFVGEVTLLGHLRFERGALVAWGATKRGKPLRPVERRRAPRGGAAASRPEARIRELVKTDMPIARGAGWLAGITRPKGNARRPDMGEAEAALELQRNARRDAVRLALGPVHARVLDLAITDASAREIGEQFGHVAKTAERKAIRMINAAIEELQKIAA